MVMTVSPMSDALMRGSLQSSSPVSQPVLPTSRASRLMIRQMKRNPLELGIYFIGREFRAVARAPSAASQNAAISQPPSTSEG